MKITRTANAGVLLEMQGLNMLLDGVCKELSPYEGTPQSIKDKLSAQFPDVVMYTHYHEDHYDEDFSVKYTKETLRSVYGPEFPLFGKMGNTKIKGIPTRHIGKTDIAHVSYVIDGEKCVWFMGDASPLDAKNIKEKKPDVIIVPYAYVTTKSAWEFTKSLGCKNIILLHMPTKENDPHKLWEAVNTTVDDISDLKIPAIGECVEL